MNDRLDSHSVTRIEEFIMAGMKTFVAATVVFVFFGVMVVTAGADDKMKDDEGNYWFDINVSGEYNAWLPARLPALDTKTSGFNNLVLRARTGRPLVPTPGLWWLRFLNFPQLEYKSNIVKEDPELRKGLVKQETDETMERYEKMLIASDPIMVWIPGMEKGDDFVAPSGAGPRGVYRKETFASQVQSNKDIAFIPFDGQPEFFRKGDDLGFLTTFEDIQIGAAAYGTFSVAPLFLGISAPILLILAGPHPFLLLATIPGFDKMRIENLESSLGYQYSYYQKPYSSRSGVNDGALGGRFPGGLDNTMYFAKFRHHGYYMSFGGRISSPDANYFVETFSSFSQGFGSDSVALSDDETIKTDIDGGTSLTASNIYYSVHIGYNIWKFYVSVLGELDYKYFFLQKSDSFSWSWYSLMPVSFGVEGSNDLNRDLMLKGSFNLGFRL